MDGATLKLMGGLLNAVSLVSARAAGRLAFSLFSRTRSPEPATDKERALFKNSAGRMAEAEHLVIRFDGGEAVVHRFPPIGTPNGLRLLFTHGWGSRIAYAQSMITGLREAGYEVFGLDLPGHGDAPGRKLNAAMAIGAICEVVTRFGPFDAMIGHSFGGYMTVLAASGAYNGRPLAVRRLAIIAAPADVRRVLGGFAKMVGLNGKVTTALIDEIKRITGKPAEAAFGPKLLAESGIPTLVLHAEEDKEVDARAARAYGEAGPNVTLTWLNGLGHRRIVNAPEAIEAVKDFLAA